LLYKGGVNIAKYHEKKCPPGVDAVSATVIEYRVDLSTGVRLIHKLSTACGNPVDKNFTTKSQLEIKSNWRWNLIGGET